MVPEQIDRLTLKWSREDLARYSGVSLASVFLIERLGSATEIDDAKIRDALARGLAERSSAQASLPSGPRTSASTAATDRTDPVSPISRPPDDPSEAGDAPRTERDG